MPVICAKSLLSASSQMKVAELLASRSVGLIEYDDLRINVNNRSTFQGSHCSLFVVSIGIPLSR